jgi:hypothetical protein
MFGGEGRYSALPERFAPVLFKGLLHVSFNRSRLKDKNMQQFKVLQRPLRVSKTRGAVGPAAGERRASPDIASLKNTGSGLNSATELPAGSSSALS